MNILIGFLYVIEVVVCLLLALVVMLQKPKDGGLGGIAGGMSEAVFGADASNVLIKVTIWLGAIFLINTLALARFTSTIHTKTLMQGQEAQPVAEQMPEMPQMPQMPEPQVPAAAPVAPAPAATPAPATPAPAPAAKPAAPVAPAPEAAKPAAPVAPAPEAAKPAAPAPAAPAK